MAADFKILAAILENSGVKSDVAAAGKQALGTGTTTDILPAPDALKAGTMDLSAKVAGLNLQEHLKDKTFTGGVRG